MEKDQVTDTYQQRVDDQLRFMAFVQELAALSKKHGVAIRSTGGVYVFTDPKEAEGLVYTNDASSSDLDYVIIHELCRLGI